jgi:phosphoenolpyruvate carboxykinase (GTP)
VSADDLDALLSVDTEGWRAAIPQIRAHYAQFGSHLPARLQLFLDELDQQLAST